jgi:hypothetical protein
MKKAWLVAIPFVLSIALFLTGGIRITLGQTPPANVNLGGGTPPGVVNLGPNNNISLSNPLGGNCNDLLCPMHAVINFLFTIAIPLCGIMVLVGGFQMLTAAGDPAKFSNGRKTILYAVAGFAVILVAGGVATLIQNTLGGS